jgi:uncharacterized lipoprotein
VTRRARPAAIAAAAAVLLVAGCSVSKTEIDAGQAEQYVKGLFPKPARTASCPSGVEAKKGRTFTCKAVDSTGRRYVVTLHIANEKGRVTVGTGDIKPVGKQPPLGTPPPLG